MTIPRSEMMGPNRFHMTATLSNWPAHVLQNKRGLRILELAGGATAPIKKATPESHIIAGCDSDGGECAVLWPLSG